MQGVFPAEQRNSRLTSATVDGKVIGKDCDFAPSTGIIIETPGFLPHNSAWRNLAILAGISGKADKARIDEVIRMVALDPNDKKPVTNIRWECGSG